MPSLNCPASTKYTDPVWIGVRIDIICYRWAFNALLEAVRLRKYCAATVSKLGSAS